MLHHYLAEHSRNEPRLHFHADNCVGQNKNKTVLAYFMWCTIVGLSEEVTLSFMRVEHTQRVVDACFGLLKNHPTVILCSTYKKQSNFLLCSAF